MLYVIPHLPTNVVIRSLFIAFFLVLLGSWVGCSSPDPKHSESGPVEESDRKIELISAKIEGASMAPYLLGNHLEAKCEHCKAGFVFDSKTGSSKQTICCPLCGHRFSPMGKTTKRSPSQVEMVKLDPSTHIKRWDVIAFRDGDQHSVKRVVGLPLEEIVIQDGNIWVNRNLVAKTPESHLESRVLVFDSAFLVEPQIEFSDGLPKQFPVKLQNEKTKLVYRHRANYDSKHHREFEPVKDYYGYNQGLSRSLNPTDEIGCELTFKNVDTTESPFVFSLIIHSPKYGAIRFQCEWTEIQLTRSVYQGKNRLLGTVTKRDVLSKDVKIFCSLIDGRARILEKSRSDNSVVLLTDQFVPRNQDYSSPIVFEHAGPSSAVLTDLKIYRDIYYFEKLPDQKHRVGKDEFFVLGDNVPVSKDSRSAAKLPKRSEIIGVLKSTAFEELNQ